ncbi:hypothetical protein OsJ_17266 [Oryza sativa Japonica Group]|uniref:Uncharacterized protein n=1 Tax=Oryza sativa subsp. japonica TaxID=39947 RepID=B9FMN9_ORYSJ|nr:hypothetical protein OsJ_17266 [Oryza sativa Japonica Group]
MGYFDPGSWAPPPLGSAPNGSSSNSVKLLVALAEKASAALVKAAAVVTVPLPEGRRRRGAVAPLVFPLLDEGEMVVAAEAAPKPAVVWKRQVACRGGRASKRPARRSRRRHGLPDRPLLSALPRFRRLLSPSLPSLSSLESSRSLSCRWIHQPPLPKKSPLSSFSSSPCTPL